MTIAPTKINYLTADKEKKMLEGIKNTKHRAIVLLMLDCGLRVSEAVSLKVSDFDFRRRELTVRTLKQREVKRTRTVPISGRLFECLAAYVPSLGEPSPDSYLFPSPDADREHLSRKAVNRFLDRLKEKYGFDKLHPHALRHTYATKLGSQGADLYHIANALGHRNASTALIYTHTPVELLRQHVEAATAEKLSLVQRIRNYFFPPRKLSINIATAGRFTIGRDQVISQVADLIAKDTNVILIGAPGVGKSHLLEQITPGEGKKVLKIDDLTNVKQTIVELLLHLLQGDKKALASLLYADYNSQQLVKKLQRDSIRNLVQQFKNITKPHEYVLVIDSVDRITPRSVAALEFLRDHVTIATSAREVAANRSTFLSNFEVIRLENLTRQHSLELIERLSSDLDIEDVALFRNHIFEQSDGNPLAIYEMVARFRKEPVISSDLIRSVRHTGGLQEYDLTAVILLVLGGAVILRYWGRETGEDSLQFLGGVAMVLLIISRWFFRFGKVKKTV